MRAPRQACGFTLVEMLVAIALLALMGIISWRGLDFVTTQRSRIDGEADEVGAILRTLAQIERDLAQRVPDVMLAPGARQELPQSIAVSTAGDGAVALEILRIAPAAGGPARAQRVVYRIAGAALVRGASPAAVDWPPPSAGDAVVIFPGARRLAVRTYAGGFWSEPGTELRVQPPAPATALEVTVEDNEGARYVRVFAL
jgi:general secretion pathway protein J